MTASASPGTPWSSSTSAAAASRSTRGSGPAVELGRSFKLGVIRLTERFVKTDPARAARRAPPGAPYRRRNRQATSIRSRDAGFERVIGTSGTILSLGTVASAAEGRAPSAPLRNRRIPRQGDPPRSARIRRARSREAAARPGLEPRRADLAVAGAILLDELLRRLGADEITLCDLSLREGLVLDYIARHRKEIAQADRYPDVRRRSVFELADRCNYWPDHSQHVARLAIGTLRPDARDSRPHRSRARVARIRRDPARHRRPASATKGTTSTRTTSMKNGDLRGFEPEEIETIALVARYHRLGDAEAPARAASAICRAARGGPSARWRRWCASPRASIAATRRRITGIEVHDRGDDDLLQLRTSGDAELELWAATRHAAPFERMTGNRSASKSAGSSETGTPTMLNNLTQPHEYPGKLFVVEGIDGSGKTTQLALLAKWLSAEGHRVFVTEWNSSALVKAATKTGKKKNALTPMTFSLLHATDFADRLLYKDHPAAQGRHDRAGRSLRLHRVRTRDATRGVDRQWVRELLQLRGASRISRSTSACRSTSRSTGCWRAASS